MPSQWKFKIQNPENITNQLLELGAVCGQSEEFEDIYFVSSPRSTKKIRVFSSAKARIIKFDRDEKGIVSNLERLDFQTLEEALNSIGKEEKEVSRFRKTVTSYFLYDVEISIHEFSTGAVFLCMEGVDEQVKKISELLLLNLESSIGLSFDEIFENKKAH